MALLKRLILCYTFRYWAVYSYLSFDLHMKATVFGNETFVVVLLESERVEVGGDNGPPDTGYKNCWIICPARY